MTTTPTRSANLASFVLPVQDDAVLLARHTYAAPDLWAMIGGMVEPGEAFPDAAWREAREETGLDLAIGDLVACVDRSDLVMMVFVGHVVGGTLLPAVEEIAELRWMGLEDLARLNVFDLARHLGRSLLSGTAIPGLSQVSVSWPDGSSRSAFISSP